MSDTHTIHFQCLSIFLYLYSQSSGRQRKSAGWNLINEIQHHFSNTTKPNGVWSKKNLYLGQYNHLGHLKIIKNNSVVSSLLRFWFRPRLLIDEFYQVEPVHSLNNSFVIKVIPSTINPQNALVFRLCYCLHRPPEHHYFRPLFSWRISP